MYLSTTFLRKRAWRAQPVFCVAHCSSNVIAAALAELTIGVSSSSLSELGTERRSYRSLATELPKNDSKPTLNRNMTA